MANHTYYKGMLTNSKHWKMIIGALVSVFIPIMYLLWHKKFSLKRFLISLFGWLFLFSLIHVSIKDNIMWTWWFLMLMINTLLLFWLAAYFVVGLLSLGSWLSSRFVKFTRHRWQEMILSFGLWLGVFLFVIRYVIMLNIFFSWLIWLVFVGLWVLIYLQKKELTKYKDLVVGILSQFHYKQLKQNSRKWIGVVLVVLSILYYFYGFQLSFIPYSTAWDANHAYMYIPKVWSLHGGSFWMNGPGGWSTVGLWHTFIAFWFSLWKPLSGWLAPDTIAVAMNFLSWIFVLIFGIGLVSEVTEYFSLKSKGIDTFKGKVLRSIALYIGWFMLLLRLTSWMWAFLVFVDNKTDLGVLALTVLALLSGFIFIRYIFEHKDIGKKMYKWALKYLLIWWAMFAFAVLAKPTAFVDVLLFGLLLTGLWFGVVAALWWWIFFVWVLWKLQMWNMRDFIAADSSLSMMLMAAGVVIVAVWIIIHIMKKGYRAQRSINHLKYLWIWIAAFLWVVLLAKVPGAVYSKIIGKDVSITHVLMWANNIDIQKKLVVDTNSEHVVQTKVDQSYLRDNTSVASCLARSYDDETLERDLKTPPASNEDVGRYVWYGWKEFKKPTEFFRLWYLILKLRYPGSDNCYAWTENDKLLCENKAAVDSFDVTKLNDLRSKMNQTGEAFALLDSALSKYDSAWYTPATPNLAKLMRDEVVAMRGYYQENSVRTENGSIFVPYKRVTPLNVSYNRSLQNLSSYYTDIWFIWLIAFGLLGVALLYGLVMRKERLTVLSLIVFVWWWIWRLIGGGIVRYGIGLIMWTILVVAILFKELYEWVEKEKWSKTFLYLLIAVLALRWIVQFTLNLVRISSQGAAWPFVRYKMKAGNIMEFNDNLQQVPKVEYGYNQQDVFNLQFPHYNKIIQATEWRDKKDGVLIAGTYLQYFLTEQENIKMDGMLSWFWKQISDNDTCKSYHRLKNANLKYLVIDPNIGTVVMWEWNETLFQRFFAKRDAVTGMIEEHGSITMLVRLRQDGYIKLFSTNNLWAKYAFEVSDDQLRAGMWQNMSTDQLSFVRAQLWVARFFPNSQQLMWFVANTFSQRMANGQALGDIADVYGKIVNINKLLQVASKMANWDRSSATHDLIMALTQDEKMVLAQYMWLLGIMKSNTEQYQNAVRNLVSQSLWWSSQLIVFEIVD